MRAAVTLTAHHDKLVEKRRLIGEAIAAIAATREIAATRGLALRLARERLAQGWLDGARRYVASLYDTDVDTWERVTSFIEET